MTTLSLFKKDNQLFARTPEMELPVTIALARLSKGFDSEIAILNHDLEIALLDSLNDLDESSRCFAKEEIRKKYLIPEITRILKTEVFLGNRYIYTETDYGDRCFIVKNPCVSIRMVPPDGIFIRDTIGNLYRITTLSALDKNSRKELDKVI
jgi:hypothetical protein